MISFKKITKKIGDNIILNDISFNISDKEIFVILGPSGSGKTTLLRTIAGLDDTFSGEIIIDGRVFDKTNSSLLHNKIGMVFQNFNLFPHMSVLDNLTYTPIVLSILYKK